MSWEESEIGLSIIKDPIFKSFSIVHKTYHHHRLVPFHVFQHKLARFFCMWPQIWYPFWTKPEAIYNLICKFWQFIAQELQEIFCACVATFHIVQCKYSNPRTKSRKLIKYTIDQIIINTLYSTLQNAPTINTIIYPTN